MAGIKKLSPSDSFIQQSLKKIYSKEIIIIDDNEEKLKEKIFLETNDWATFIRERINSPAPYTYSKDDPDSPGIAGNLTAGSIEAVLQVLKNYFKEKDPRTPIHFLDIGSGEGCPCVTGLLRFNFDSCTGIEISKPVADHSTSIIQSFLKRIKRTKEFGGRWSILNHDIETVLKLPDTISCVYSFWTGMPIEIMAHIVALCLKSPNIKVLAVSLVPKKDQREILKPLYEVCQTILPDPLPVKYGKRRHCFAFFDFEKLSESQRDTLWFHYISTYELDYRSNIIL